MLRVLAARLIMLFHTDNHLHPTNIRKPLGNRKPFPYTTYKHVLVKSQGIQRMEIGAWRGREGPRLEKLGEGNESW